MRFLENLCERLGGWLGIEIDDQPDPLVALAPYGSPPRVPIDDASAERIARIFETLRTDCEHYHYEGVDSAPNTPDKVWECSSCGWLFRIVVNPEKPWFVRELRQVDDLTASHAVSGAATLTPPAPAVVALDAPSHIDLSDAS